MKKLVSYSWPGNVRELENVIERAVVISKTEELNCNDLPDSLNNYAGSVQSGIVANVSLSDIERSSIIEALEENGWNISKTSKQLKIDRTTLYNKMKKYEIDKKNE